MFEYRTFLKFAIGISILVCLVVIVFNAVTTPSLISPTVVYLSSQTSSDHASDQSAQNNGDSDNGSSSNTKMLWDINRVTKDQLCEIDNIGEKTAKAILDYRDKIGKFNQIEELTEIPGIGEKTFDTLKNHLYVE